MIERVYLPYMPTYTPIIMYISFILSVILFSYGMDRKIRLLGISSKNLIASVAKEIFQNPRRFVHNFFSYVVLQSKTRQSVVGNMLHSSIFYGFLILIVGTALVAIDADFLAHVTEFKILQGGLYLVFETIMDAAGLLVFAGVIIALYRRVVSRPNYVHSGIADYFALALLLAILASGFALEGIRLAITPSSYAGYSFVGAALSNGFLKSISPDLLRSVYPALWNFHMLLMLCLLVVTPYTKFIHVLLIPFNLLVTPPKDAATKGKLSTPFNILEMDAEGEGESDVPASVGVGNVQELKWEERLQVLSCVNCGRCEKVCPANNSGRVLSPRNIMQKLIPQIELGGSAMDLFDEVIAKEEMWGCTNCYACVEVCPAFINHVNFFIDFRRSMVNGSLDDDSKIAIFSNIERNGNPYGLPSYSRTEWLESRQVPTVADKDSFEYLYFIGCSSCYDQRCRSVADAVISILNAAGVDYAILGEQERCCGEPAKRMGEEGLFQMTALQNIELWESFGVQKILVNCPHCYNMLKHEYQDFKGNYQVVHHSELIMELIRDKKLNLKNPEQITEMTFHDPCNLGRINGITVPPREILGHFGPLREMERTSNLSFCCGAGAGNAFYRVSEEKRISAIRFEEAMETGASIVAVACPFCLNMFEDVRGGIGKEVDAPKVVDIAELVAHNLS
ncbi:(Fe-S)-binding protein [Geobacter grbiciae]|uniref:(Fe-S)-binding protein n=1 Tax=Geobacter grbiciae TaxID=155042 RepID=UPI001C02FF0A|nr:(Fe-S)-binding protein [Geobacter grbiciae]MBT1077164.1 (Fe-S)-binding protein [Geobacter grbiciae]